MSNNENDRPALNTDPSPGSNLSSIKKTTSTITMKNRWDHFKARWAINRMGHRVEPGLYALGNPDSSSPVFATANYTLSFDTLRQALNGIDCYILVLDTKGINVWCAAGGKLFGTDELVHRIEVTGLHKQVNHRKIILPQLSASGVSAHEVKKRSGFRVEYGPVRAADLAAYLKTRSATPEMRTVYFLLQDRLMLVGVEVMHALLPMVIIAAALFFTSGFLAAAATFASIFAGIVLFPILLPWIPTPNFSTKGFILGGIAVLPLILLRIFGAPEAVLWWRLVTALSFLLIFPSITAFITLNFTGSTTFTSRSGVRQEIFSYFPAMAWMFAGGVVCAASAALVRLLKG